MSDDLPEGDRECCDGNHGPPPCPGDLTGPLVDFEEIEASAALDHHDPALVEEVARATNTDPAVVRAVLTLLQAKGVLATASPAFTNHGDRVTVEWPTGRGPTAISPEMVDAWVATQNEVRRLRAEVARIRASERVLVVDPDEGFIQATRGELPELGWQHLTCHCGVQFDASIGGVQAELRPVHYPDGSHGFEAFMASGGGGLRDTEPKS